VIRDDLDLKIEPGVGDGERLKPDPNFPAGGRFPTVKRRDRNGIVSGSGSRFILRLGTSDQNAQYDGGQEKTKSKDETHLEIYAREPLKVRYLFMDFACHDHQNRENEIANP